MAYRATSSTLLCLVLQLCILVGVSASLSNYRRHADQHVVDDLDSFAQWEHGQRSSPRAAGQWLRILPLGASITAGQRGDGNTSNAVSHNGYRKPLRDKLRSRNYNVNMIGCLSEGQMRDRDNEGHRGFLISQVATKVACAIDLKPNIVLINAGTNDAVQSNNLGGETFLKGSQDRMKVMIDDIFSQVKDVTVILSTLLPNRNTAASNINTINAGYRSLVSQYQAAGKKVQLADMNTGWITTAELPDGTHPIDAGYKKMAAIWDQAILAAANKNWIKDPIDTGKPDDKFDCDPTPGSFTGPTQTQRGSGADDGTFSYSSSSVGVLSSDVLHEKGSSATPNRWATYYHFAQLVNGGGGGRGQETDELIRVTDGILPVADSGLPAFSFKLNSAGTYGSGWTTIDVKQFCNNRGVHWGDVNNDGLDDMICISPEGDMYVSINKGGNPPTFQYIGQAKKNEGVKQEFVRLGDIDGDGRLDYCIIRGSGQLYCWRNGGVADMPSWEIMVGGMTFDASGMGDIAGMRLVDVNGDARSDFVILDSSGKSRIIINQRGTKEDGPRLKPHWIEASSGHPGGFSGMTVNNFKFGRIFGSGKADYIVVKESNTQDSVGVKHTYNFDVYKNTGNGGTKVKGDGVYYCDMYGRGHDDYLWVYEAGNVNLFENSGAVPNWIQHNEIINVGRDRKSIHFGDWNGDGLCDILSVNKQTGSVDWWQNTWTKGKAVPTFTYKGQALAGGCTQGWGVSRYDLGVQFADVDGDARVDYLCIDPAGTTTAILNQEKGFRNAGQIKFSIGKDRQEIRFADVDNDGKDDYLAVDKATGDVTIFTNEGEKKSTGSAGAGDSTFSWVQDNGMWISGVDRGANMFFARMSNSSGRVDFVRNLPATDIAYTYFNQPCKGGGDDPTTDLPLPTPPNKK